MDNAQKNQEQQSKQSEAEKLALPIIVKKSPTFLAFQIGVLILFSVITIVALILLNSFIATASESLAAISSIILIVLAFAIGLFNLIAIVLGFLKWNAECYEIREDEIVHIQGILNKRKRSYPLAKVETINLEQGYLGRALDYGTVSLLNPILPEHRRLNLVGIPQPQQYIELIKHIQEKLLENAPRDSHTVYRTD